MDADIKVVKDMIEKEGFKVVRVEYGKHRKFIVTVPPDHKVERTIVAALSPSCRRSALNLRSTVRNIARRATFNKTKR